MKLSQLSLADYNQLDGIPVINQDLAVSGFTPVTNTYYKHTGTTMASYTNGVIYYYNGTGYVALDGSAYGLATVAKTGSYNDLLDKPTIPTDYVPNTRKVNNKELSSDITLGAPDVGALPTSGGTVTGNLTVGGNLTINGTTTTVDSTTLQVKDKLIEVAHGNTTTLTTPAGLVAPKYDGTNSGALVFDSTGTAYVGDVTLKDGNIDVANSDLQPLATRTGLVGGNLVQYDSSAQTLKDSGKKIDDLATTSQVNAKYTKPSGGIPKTDLASDVQASLGKADSALQSAPVTSVNGKTGAVTIDIPEVVQSTGQSVTNVMSQKAVTDELNKKANSADLATVATSGSYSDLRNIPTDIAKIGNLSNPNLLINPNFAINQRGKTLYTGAVYGVDRWKGDDPNLTVTPVANGIKIAQTGQYNAYIKQIVETNLAGKTVTASCKLSAINSGEGGRFALYYTTDGTSWTILNDATITVAGISKLTVNVPSNARYISVDVGVRPNSDVVFEWAKLEIGSVATEFSPPSIAEELQKCYRYYKKITNLQQQTYSGLGIAYGDGSGARANIEGTFRTVPTVTSSGSFAIVANGDVKTVSSMSLQSFNSTNVVVKFTLNSALADGLCGYLLSNNSPGAYIALDAEL